MIGMAAHVVCVDKDMRVHVEEAGGDVMALGADRAPRLILRQPRSDRDDLAAGGADIHAPLEPGGRVEHLAVCQQQIVLHGIPTQGFVMSSVTPANPVVIPGRHEMANPEPMNTIDCQKALRRRAHVLISPCAWVPGSSLRDAPE